jgi:hypothetical protein
MSYFFIKTLTRITTHTGGNEGYFVRKDETIVELMLKSMLRKKFQ